LQIYDVVKLSHHFGVSVLSALYRLMNLRLITDKQFGEMKQMDSDGMTKQLADLLGLSEVSEDENISAFYRRYLVLALEAYRREKISRRKLIEIASKLGVGATEIEQVFRVSDWFMMNLQRCSFPQFSRESNWHYFDRHHRHQYPHQPESY